MENTVGATDGYLGGKFTIGPARSSVVALHQFVPDAGGMSKAKPLPAQSLDHLGGDVIATESIKPELSGAIGNR
jgi:hypothetical protein